MIFVFDGAMGTMLQQEGLAPGYCPELWNVENPAAVTAIHSRYVESGADIIEANTFGANRIKLTHYGLADRVTELNKAAVKAARAACGSQTKVAGSVGPTGKFIAPLGELSFDAAYDVYFEQIAALNAAGVDMIIIETIIDIQEMRAALLAAKAATAKPVVCQLSFGADGRTLTGTDPRTAAVVLEAMGADIVGANCSLGPAQLLPVVAELAAACGLPVSVQPNAGMPELVNGQTVFPMGPAEMGAWTAKLVAAGATYLGGCCGTTPEHIKAIRTALAAGIQPAARAADVRTALTSRSQTVYLGAGLPTVIIGERINPTGRKALAAEIREGSFAAVKREALEQVNAGAKVLDVNMGVPGIDQAAAMAAAVTELSVLVDVPLAIDTTDAAALEAGLKAFPGRALINSVSAEPDRLEQFLPLAKKYGAAVLCLPIAPGGVPATADERVKIAGDIVRAALAAGLRPQDLLLDPLVLTVAADARAAQETLATLRAYRRHFGFPAVMGLSNVSYGLPRRDLMNATFCAMALDAGLDAPILNPYDPAMRNMLSAAAAILGHDPQGQLYSTANAGITGTAAAAPAPPADVLAAVKQAVTSGQKEAVAALVRQALTEGHSPLAVTDRSLTAAMNEVGEAFGKGRCFLPQVMLAAETMRAAFLTLKEELPSHRADSLGTVVLATVRGDIHDLGKNIVAALMENNGIRVVDLGKDVPAEVIVAAAEKEKADIVGLCALMTTTMPQIDTAIAALKAAGNPARTIVGGAVLTADYAAQAGADAYAGNGVEAVNIAKRLLGK
ncbi:homocysteine S-methyltransferase family protein [Anaeroselena agilis]|uniref:Methionine synthase n=1 Tax=Anaeroselena agilis TaxID=3063788 RepID=A0ABU3P2U9_9FIRM|nr:homocysteine S-methyltransferase family protein [Selenomonadales bacterium 4137-cl]